MILEAGSRSQHIAHAFVLANSFPSTPVPAFPTLCLTGSHDSHKLLHFGVCSLKMERYLIINKETIVSSKGMGAIYHSLTAFASCLLWLGSWNSMFITFKLKWQMISQCQLTKQLPQHWAQESGRNRQAGNGPEATSHDYSVGVSILGDRICSSRS